MIELALRTTVVLALAFAIAAVLRRATPATRHLVWHITLLIVVTAPLLQPLTPRFPLPERLSPSTIADNALRALGPRGTESTHGTPSTSATLRTPGTSGTSGTLRTLGALNLIAVWTIGSAVTALWFSIGWLMSMWMRGHAERAPGAIAIEARAVARQMGLKRAPDVRVTSDARGPLTVGLLNPSILLPSLAIDWSSERRRAVLTHELAHVRRGDIRTQALAHIACTLYWFNPLAWLAARALRRERERACDDAVLVLGVRASSYAQDLLDIARLFDGRGSPSAALAMARRSELEGRLLSLLATDRHRRPARATRWAVSTAVALGAIVAFGAHTAGKAPHAETALPEERSRPAAVWYDAQLAASDDSSAIAGLITALGDASGQVREKAAMGLAIRSSPEVVEPLLRALQDPDSQVREKAAMGLSLRRDARVVDALLVAATDVDAQVREKVLMALGTSGDPRAIDALRAALRDTDSQVREKAAMGLVLPTSTPMGPVDRAAIESGVTWAVNAVLRAIR